MKSKSDTYTVQQALTLAHRLKHGPWPAPEAPMPTLDEAIAVIQEERRTCGFTWITGETAVRVLEEAKTKGTDVKTKILVLVQRGAVAEVRTNEPESIDVQVIDADSLMAGGNSRSAVEKTWVELAKGTIEIEVS